MRAGEVSVYDTTARIHDRYQMNVTTLSALPPGQNNDTSMMAPATTTTTAHAADSNGVTLPDHERFKLFEYVFGYRVLYASTERLIRLVQIERSSDHNNIHASDRDNSYPNRGKAKEPWFCFVEIACVALDKPIISLSMPSGFDSSEYLSATHYYSSDFGARSGDNGSGKHGMKTSTAVITLSSSDICFLDIQV